jgi:hypothetical protein
VDEAQELRADGRITSDQLRTLERELAEEMPESVRAKLKPEYRPQLADDQIGKEPQVAQSIAPARIIDAPTF